RAMKYGFFVHYVWGGSAYQATINPDGSVPVGLDELANRFDAARLAEDLASMRVEYVIFTAWHANMNCLWPSANMNQWLPGHASKRDVVGEMIKAVKAKGIRVILYTHPRDGHDLTAEEQAATGWGPVFDHAKWNNFINDIYGDLVSRYGQDILGIYIDEGRRNADYVDYERLRKTIKAGNPKLMTLQNFFGNAYGCDLAHVEFHPPKDFNVWKASSLPAGVLIGGNWWAAVPKEKSALRFSAETMVRYTVLKAGISSSAGGVAWAAGNYSGGGWEKDVLETMQSVARYLAPIARTITNTHASTAYTTPGESTFASLQWGVATKSTDDRLEYIHVLKPPSGRVLSLAPPADRKLFSSARLVANGQPVRLSQDGSGVTLTLTGTNAWDKLDTAIELEVSGAMPFSASTFSDDFSRENRCWQTAGGNWAFELGEHCQSNTAGFGNTAGLLMDKWSDATYEFDFKIVDAGNSAANWAGCNLRKTIPADHFSVSGYMIYFRANGQACLHQEPADLVRVNSGLAFTNWTHVKITTSGPGIKVYLTNSAIPLIEFNRATNTVAGYFSLTTGGTHSHFDNVTITPLNTNLPKRKF
ncbi:MAG: alpha-L-fucosidase, partial [Akkermansiaceae bacterium]|nr:alpha-L-fucosidase [Verrucomicrobiales bacterium]